MKTLYTVSKCKPNDDIYGPSHGSDDGNTTLCGKDCFTGGWWITDNSFEGEIDCKKCIDVLAKYPTIQQRLKERK
jgi:hypothetical protein